MPNSVNVLFIGDIVGSYGRAVVKLLLPVLKRQLEVDLTVANGENAAHGYSLTEKIYLEFLDMGIDALTMGNHVWEKREVLNKIELFDRMVRPANYPPGTPGRDSLVVTVKDIRIGLINLLGRVFMPALDCPFQAAEKLLARLKEKTDVVILDFHAEATSEKCAMGYFLDGRAAAVIGTHTHVMTADERLLPNGTAYISDAGMVGARDSIIGMKKEQILKRFVTQLPEKFEPADAGPGLFNAVLLKIDPVKKKPLEIKRVQVVLESLNLDVADKINII